MAWTIKFTPKIKKELRRLDKKDSRALLDFLKFEIIPLSDPREKAIPLKGNLKEYYKFVVGSFRIIADLQDEELLILVIRIGTRENFYAQVEHPQTTRVLDIDEIRKKI